MAIRTESNLAIPERNDPHGHLFAWRTTAFRALCWSLILHGFFASLVAQWIWRDGQRHAQETWHRFEFTSVLLSSEQADTIETLAEPTIIAPDGLPMVAELPLLAMQEHAPDIAALHPGEMRANSDGEFIQVQEANESSLLALAAEKPLGGGYEGRLNPHGRAELLGTRGGTPESEQAVARGLQWLVAHQGESGAWSLNLHTGPCQGRCRDSGTASTANGATALALLPLLGAGHTTQHGGHRTAVARGMQSLLSNARATPYGLDLHQGNMYAQGLATIVLCENYAMTNDATFKEPAQGAVDFIVHAQHSAGGWRYFPKQPGDMTVFGWQILALESARRAKLTVPPQTLTRASQFLQSMQSVDGSAFGYSQAGEQPTPTAIGWLCRMVYGSTRRDENCVRGVERLRAWGVSKHDLYFNFHATQVLSQYPGHEWSEWNEELREYLIATQSQQGHETGSWHFSHEHAHAGGRLYSTALATLTLEVYYRQLPLFNQPSSSKVALRSER
jgi:hypothetical protein